MQQLSSVASSDQISDAIPQKMFLHRETPFSPLEDQRCPVYWQLLVQYPGQVDLCMHEEAFVCLCKQDVCARTGKGVPILILSLRPFRPPGTRRSTLGILLNSIAFRQARTTAFCAMHSFVRAAIACKEAWHRTVRPARAPTVAF